MVKIFTCSCGVGDCHLSGDHPTRSSSENGNYFFYSYYGFMGDLGYEAYCPLGANEI
jgi:hypothetical protein